MRQEYKAQDIIKNIEQQLPNNVNYSEFYVGVTKDFIRRINNHNVDFHSKTTICYSAIDKSNAIAVAQYFIDKGMKGNVEDVTYDFIYVYCYKITGITIENYKE